MSRRAGLILLALMVGSHLRADSSRRIEVVGAWDEDYVRSIVDRTVGLEGPDPDAIRQSLEGMGAFETIGVEMQADRIRIEVAEAAILTKLKLTCSGDCASGIAMRDLSIQPGSRIFEADLEAARERVLETLGRRGFPQAQAEFVREAAGPRHVRLEVRVEEGEPSRIGEITVSPDSERARILELMDERGLRPGRVADGRLLRDVVEGWRRRAERAGVIGAWGSVSAGEGEQAPVVFELRRGPALRIQINGEEVSWRRRRALLEDAPGTVEGALLQVCETVEDELEARGFFYREVACTVVEDIIAVKTERGPRVRVSEVTADLPGELRSVLAQLQTRPSGYDLVDGYIVSRPRREVLELDRGRLTTGLALEGFPAAVVGKPGVDRSGGRVRVHFPVELGPRAVVAWVEREGLEGVEIQDWQVFEGGPYHPGRVEEDRGRVEGALRAAGHVGVEVTADVEEVGENRFGVRMRASSNGRIQVGFPVVGGALTIPPRRVERIARLNRGEVLDRQGQIRIEERLRRVPLFRGVGVKPLEEEAGPVPVKLQVREARRYRFRYGLGYNSDEGPRLSLGLTDQAVFRRAWALAILGRVSAKEYRGEMSLRNPYGFAGDRPVEATVFHGREEREGFGVERTGGLVETQLIKRGETGDRQEVGLRLLRQEVQLFDVDISESEIPRDQRSISMFSATGSWIWDHRDDPVSPRRGFRSQAVLEWAEPVLGADASFWKGNLELFAYLPVVKDVILAAAIRSGRARPTGGRTDLPISERFFLGGASGMRAFDRDEVGPRDETGKPLGGQAYHHEVVELRIPIWGDLGATLFYERGDVTAEAGDLSLGSPVVDVGLGVRYRTPAGPIRLEYARELGGEEGASRILLSLGESF